MESTCLLPVAPVRPVAPYIGGKRNLAKRLVGMIEAVPHQTYAEPFVGMGGVFLRRRRRPRCELINDWSRDVANFYRIAQAHHGELLNTLRRRITSRAEFERLRALDPSTLTDIQRAARFVYLQKVAFGGVVTRRTFGMDTHRPARFNALKLEPMLEDLHGRLAGVIVEALPWRAFVERYDTPQTLFYLDPPYWGSEGEYGADLFSRAEFEEMAEVLAQIRGRFILTNSDTPEVRRIFGSFDLEAVGVTYGIKPGAATAGRELIITN